MGLRCLDPQPVPIVLQGETYFAQELQIKHLAAFDNWIFARQGDLYKGLSDPDEETRWANLRVAYERAEIAVDGLGGANGQAMLLGTVEGAAIIILAVLRAHNLSAEDCVELAQRMNAAPGEFAALIRIGWANDPYDTISAIVDSELGISIPSAVVGEGVTWDEAISRFMHRSKCVDPVVIGNLYMSQWNLFWQPKKERAERFTGNPSKDAEIMIKRAEFWSNSPFGSAFYARDDAATPVIGEVVGQEHSDQDPERPEDQA